jgi:glutamate decarboxylase
MALHTVRKDASETFDDVYFTKLSEEALPKHKIPEQPSDPRAVYSLIRDELAVDGNASQNLATFCTTWAEPEVHRLMDDNLEKNMIDKDEYPQTAEIESRCVHILADLWSSPEADSTIGCSTTGSSEAAMLGGLALKWRWRQRREAEGKPTDKPNIVAGPVQICWDKFARYFDVEMRQVPLLKDATGLRPEQLRDYVDENTIGVVGILGVTYTCDYEPIAELAEELDAIERDTGLDIPIHVDAASGGFIAPFVHPNLAWDFRIERVASINASGHKYGLSPLGVGWAVWRSEDMLPEDLIFRVNYLGGDMPTFALNFVAQYYNLLRLGREGYRRIQQACLDTAQWLGDQVQQMGPFQVLYGGKGALPAISYTLEDPSAQDWTLYDLTDQLRMRGWQVPAYPLPADREETVIQRVLVRHGIGRDKMCLLVEDMQRCIEKLDRGAGAKSDEQPGFHH